MNLTKEQIELALKYAVAFLELEIEKVESQRNTMYGESRKTLEVRLNELYEQLVVFQNVN